MRAYYTTHIQFDNFLNSYIKLAVSTNFEHATSIIVASTPVCAPVLHKWFHGDFILFRKRLNNDREARRSFRRIGEHTDHAPPESIELGQTRTTIQEPGRAEMYLRSGLFVGENLEDDFPRVDAKPSPNTDSITVKKEIQVRHEI